jgi:hypothetical protein
MSAHECPYCVQGVLVPLGPDPCLPPHVVKHECDVCEVWIDHDTEDDSWAVDA